MKDNPDGALQDDSPPVGASRPPHDEERQRAARLRQLTREIESGRYRPTAETIAAKMLHKAAVHALLPVSPVSLPT